MAKVRSNGLAYLLFMAVAMMALLMCSSPVFATSQWSKKYGLACTTCHTTFPRLNYYGERFLRNGYQDPESAPDGDTTEKTKIHDSLFLTKLGHILGIRLNVDMIRATTKDITVNDKKKTRLRYGSPNWVQFFVAGSIFKNTSIFIEMEHLHDGFEFTWFYFTFPNLYDTWVNFQVGHLSPLEFSSYPNRLRIMSAVKGDVFGVSSSHYDENISVNPGEDSVNVSGSRPGIQYYGYRGPFVWWVGSSPGSKAKDPNDKKHYWLGFRWEVPSDTSAFQGSSITLYRYDGTDATDSDTNQITNDFSRNIFEGNLRWGDFDIQAAYIDAKDENWYLSDLAPQEVDWDGISVVAGYQRDKWNYAAQYDTINYDLPAPDPEIEDLEKFTASVGYSPRENFRIQLYARIDMNSDTGHTKSHDYFINIRTMF